MIEQFKYADIVDASQNLVKELCATNFEELNEAIDDVWLSEGIYVIKLFLSKNRYYAIDFVVEN